MAQATRNIVRDRWDDTVEEALRMVPGIIHGVARRRRLASEDAEDLASTVRLKLLSENCAVLRAFRGKSSLRTYLTVVVHRVLLDELAARWGKWRPSAAVRRVGPAAVTLDRLVCRDGVPFEQACEMVRARFGPSFDVARVAETVQHRRHRRPIQRLVAIEGIPEPVSVHRADSEMKAASDARTLRHAMSSLNAALAALDPEDHLIVKLRFIHGLPLSIIARKLSLDSKSLYRRMRRLLRLLHGRLEANGIARAEVLDALNR